MPNRPQIDLSKEQRETDSCTPDLTAEQVAYAIKDAEILVQLVKKLWSVMHEMGSAVALVDEMKCLPAVAQMKRMGLPFDADALSKLTEECLAIKPYTKNSFTLS